MQLSTTRKSPVGMRVVGAVTLPARERPIAAGLVSSSSRLTPKRRSLALIRAAQTSSPTPASGNSSATSPARFPCATTARRPKYPAGRLTRFQNAAKIQANRAAVRLLSSIRPADQSGRHSQGSSGCRALAASTSASRRRPRANAISPPTPTPPNVRAKSPKNAACFQSPKVAMRTACTAANTPKPANGSRNSTTQPIAPVIRRHRSRSAGPPAGPTAAPGRARGPPPPAPLAPGSVVQRAARLAQQMKREQHGAGARARAAGGHHRAPWIDSRRLEPPPQLVRWQQKPLGVHQGGGGHAPAPGDVPGPKPGTGLGIPAREPPGRAGVHDLLGTASGERQHLLERADLSGAKPRAEASG